jgi:hypothetical protein
MIGKYLLTGLCRSGHSALKVSILAVATGLILGALEALLILTLRVSYIVFGLRCCIILC